MQRQETLLDSSALLALLHGEPGAEQVAALVGVAAISSVNWSEVVQKLIERGGSINSLRELEALGLEVVPFTADQAELAAHLWERTRHLGLSLGDRACLATAITMNARAVTTDRAWRDLNVGVQVQLVR